MNITFAGCGFLGIYHVGVSSCFSVHAPNLIEKAGGASAGALAACCLLCGADLGKITEDVLNTADDARSRTLGPLHPRFDINQVLLDGLKRTLPPNAHDIVSGKLFVSLTRVSDRKNVIVSEFTSKDDLIQALLCSAFVPFYTGILPPIFRGVRYVDGGISDNLPKIAENTVTVSPFSGGSDISPASEEISRYLQITLSNTHIQITASNLYRISRALFPPEPKVLGQMCQQGFNDALKYLITNGLIPCKKHKNLVRSNSMPDISTTNVRSVAIADLPKRRHFNSEVRRPMLLLQRAEAPVEVYESESESTDDEEDAGLVMRRDSTLEVGEAIQEVWQTWENEDFFEDEEACHVCHQNLTVQSSLPPQVIDALQASCMKVNSGLANFLFNSKVGRVLRVASLPYVLPFEAAYSFTRRFAKWLPYLPSDMQWFLAGLIQAVEHILELCGNSKAFRARFSCRLDMTDDFLSDFAKHWFRITKRSALESNTDDIEALDIAASTPSTPNQRHNLNFEFSMDFKSSSTPVLNLEPYDLLTCEDETQETRAKEEPGATLRGAAASLQEEINSDIQESFDYTIKIAQEMEDTLYFHYLQVSQVVDYDHGESSVEIHEI